MRANRSTAQPRVIGRDYPAEAGRSSANEQEAVPGLSAVERDRLIRSVMSSQALEGVDVSYEVTARLLDEVLREPLAEIG
ncbi:MAG: hypothetical protein HY332_25410 [Chloroflexi bacterium]|nr:hypothetical protein [Chloroflexota bacterium]